MNPLFAGVKQLLSYYAPFVTQLIFRYIQFLGPFVQGHRQMQNIGAGFLTGGFIVKITFRAQP